MSWNLADKGHRLISCLYLCPYLYVLMIMTRIDSSGVILWEVAGNHPYHLVSWGTPRAAWAARGGHRKRVGYKPVHEQAVTEQCNCLPNNVYVDVGEIHYIKIETSVCIYFVSMWLRLSSMGVDPYQHPNQFTFRDQKWLEPSGSMIVFSERRYCDHDRVSNIFSNENWTSVLQDDEK